MHFQKLFPKSIFKDVNIDIAILMLLVLIRWLKSEFLTTWLETEMHNLFSLYSCSYRTGMSQQKICFRAHHSQAIQAAGIQGIFRS